MWFDILKNAKTVAQTQGSFDFEEEEIPEENEQDDCKKWLKGLYDIINKYKDIDDGHPYAYKKGPKQNVIKLDKIPENLACAIKDFYDTYGSQNEIGTDLHDIKPFLKKHGVEGFDSVEEVRIDTSYFDVVSYDIHLKKDDESLLKAEVSFDWYNGPLKDISDKITYTNIDPDFNEDDENLPFSPMAEKEIIEFVEGKHKLTKRICSFIKEFYEYINQPKNIDWFIETYAGQWARLEKSNHKKEKEWHKNLQETFEKATKQYL